MSHPGPPALGSVVVLLIVSVLLTGQVVGQVPPTGRAHLFVLDLSGTPVGEFPTAVKQLKGSMEVALKDGVPMLKASASSEFLITLPQGLPLDFTLEFDLVPKACCNPQDLSFEGTPTINQGAGSAHILWDSDGYLAVIGGGPNNYEAPMPEDLRATLPGVLTRVVAVVQGPTVRLYTNGRRHYTLDKQFARGRVLRVFLGVDPGAQDPVYLAGLRILAGAFPPTAGIPITPVLASPPTGSITPMTTPPPVGTLVGGSTKPPGTVVSGTASQSQASTGGSVPTTVSNVSVTQGANGPVVSWQPVSVPAAYLVRRWKIDDVTCCSNTSPAASPLTGPPWQDTPLSVAGTYVYEVTATMSGGIASGQAQFVHFQTAGQIAAVVPAAPPVPTVSAQTTRAPRAVGSATLVFGPATLTSTARPGWGVTLQWPEVVNAPYYRIERGATNQSFALLTTITVAVSQPQAGTHTFDDVTVLPGSTSFYRVYAMFFDGAAAASPVTRYDAPTQVAQVSNLTVSVTGPCDVTSPSRGCTPYSPTPTSSPWWRLTWTWVPAPGALTHEVGMDPMIDPAVGFLQSGGISLPAGHPPSWSQYYEGGRVKKVRFCVSLVRPASGDPITNGTCLVTDIP